MLKLSASLGLKYFRSSKGAFVSFTSIMAVIGLTIGVAALIIVTSVMNGFERELKTRILQAIPHASIQGNINKDEVDGINESLMLNSNVLGAAPYIETQGLLSSGTYLKGVYIFGVDPQHEKNVSTIEDHFVEGSLDSLQDNN